MTGLGYHKAKHIINQLQDNGDLTIRKEIYNRKLVEKKVYDNCIGFLKIAPVSPLDS